MMTPLGRGGQMYARSRRWPQALAVLLVVVLIAAAGAGVWWWWGHRDASQSGEPRTPTKTCHTPVAQTPKSVPSPAAVDVDVANGTDTAGLAIDTADSLALVGFNVVGIGNTDQPVKQGVAIIRYGHDGEASALRLASYIPHAQLVLLDQRKGSIVQLWLGPKFDGLATGKDVDLESVQLPTPTPVCHKVHSGKSSKKPKS